MQTINHMYTMIQNKKDLNYYIEQDRKKLNFKKPSFLKRLLYPGKISTFQETLRKAEYYNNTANKSIINRFLSLYYKRLYSKRALQLGFTIPLNTFGPGLSIAHYGTIVVNGAARIGANCRIHVCVNIGASNASAKAPKIGNNVYIAPGCKIFGDITIADNIVIAANSVVNKSFLQPGVLIGGIPAKVLKEYGDDTSFSWRSDDIDPEVATL